jgi:hypothetical protein
MISRTETGMNNICITNGFNTLCDRSPECSWRPGKQVSHLKQYFEVLKHAIKFNA